MHNFSRLIWLLSILVNRPQVSRLGLWDALDSSPMSSFGIRIHHSSKKTSRDSLSEECCPEIQILCWYEWFESTGNYHFDKLSGQTYTYIHLWGLGFSLTWGSSNHPQRWACSSEVPKYLSPRIGFAARMSSIAFSSSAVNWTSAAWRFSKVRVAFLQQRERQTQWKQPWEKCTYEEPGSGIICGPREATQAMLNCEGLTPFFSAMAEICFTTARFESRFSCL